ncbi:membrane protein [Spirochaetia bacterium]|nr:membrane protein [Spirochaetia bacterium]
MDFESFIFSPWFWLCLAVLCAIIEFFTAWTLTTIWFGISAFLIVVPSGLGLPFQAQIGIFLLVSLVLLIFTRPIALKKLKIGQEKTNVDSWVGKTVLVTKTISEFETGEIKLNGLVWTAVSHNAQKIDAGTKCTIVRIDGVKAVVKSYDD